LKICAGNGCFLPADFLFCRLFHDFYSPFSDPGLPMARVSRTASPVWTWLRMPL